MIGLPPRDAHQRILLHLKEVLQAGNCAGGWVGAHTQGGYVMIARHGKRKRGAIETIVVFRTSHLVACWATSTFQSQTTYRPRDPKPNSQWNPPHLAASLQPIEPVAFESELGAAAIPLTRKGTSSTRLVAGGVTELVGVAIVGLPLVIYAMHVAAVPSGGAVGSATAAKLIGAVDALVVVAAVVAEIACLAVDCGVVEHAGSAAVGATRYRFHRSSLPVQTATFPSGHVVTPVTLQLDRRRQ